MFPDAQRNAESCYVGRMQIRNRKQAQDTALGSTESIPWMSKAVLLVVAPWMAAQFLLEFQAWLHTLPSVAWITLGLSILMAGVVWRLRAGTAGAAALGATILGCLIWGTIAFPYTQWLRTGITPLLVTLLLTLTATRVGQHKRGERNTREAKSGRNAAQVASNLGIAGIAVTLVPFAPQLVAHNPNFASLIAYAALAEAAADTVSSEMGQSFGGTPRLITTWKAVPAGTDGAVTLTGTLAGIAAAAVVAVSGIWALTGSFQQQWIGLLLIFAGGCVGWLADSVLGAALERRGWLNNDAVNFLSTLCAASTTLILARACAAWLLART